MCNGRLLSPGAAALLWRRIVATDPESEHVVSPLGLAQAAHRAWRRMQAWQIPAAALVDEDSAETRAFARWVQQYVQWLMAQSAVDPDQLPGLIHPESLARPLRLHGFDELAPAQSALVERLREAGVDVMVTAPTARRGDCTRVESRDARGELEAAARWAAARLDAEPALRLGIVVPGLGGRQAEVRRALERVLLPATGLVGGPAPGTKLFEIAEAPALSRHAVVGAALELLAAAYGSADLAACGRLLRSPWLQGAATEAAARAMLDAWMRRNCAADVGVSQLVTLATRRDCPLLAATLAQATGLAGQQADRALPSAWCDRFHEMLTVLGWPGESLASAGFQAAERLRDLLAELATADEVVGRLDAAAALRLLREYADGVSFEPQAPDAALTVIEPEASAGMSFDGLWISGMEASRWPAPASPDPFLPRAWQLRREMPGASAALAQRQSQLLFERLLRSADEVVASVAQFEDDTPVLASALLAKLPIRTQTSGWSGSRLAVLIHKARPSLERRVDGRLPRPASGRPARGGARLLELQSACPFRAGAEFRLHARPLEAPAPGLGAAQRGELVHAVLARVWRVLGDQAGLAATGEAELRHLLQDSIAAETARLRANATPLLQRLLDLEAAWLEARLVELTACDRERMPFAVEALEATLTATFGPLALEVKPDRVDRLSDGSLAVIDYKTGGDTETRAWLGERPRLPQLPLYALALDATRVSAAAFGRVRAAGTGYVGIARRPQDFGGIASFGTRDAPKGVESWEELVSTWRERLTVLVQEYADGDARLAPVPEQACRYCHLAGLCRIDETTLRTEREDPGDA